MRMSGAYSLMAVRDDAAHRLVADEGPMGVVQAPARVNVAWVTPLGEVVASIA